MKIARVVGNLVSTCKEKTHEGSKILAVCPVDLEGKISGESFLAVDCAQAGIGDYVLVIEEGNSCRQLMNNDKAAVDAAIAGVVDMIEVQGKKLKFH